MMQIEKITTLGQLKKSGWTSKSIKEELRLNLISSLQKKIAPFQGIHGYEHTVIPELERAILSKHNINLLGLRGQAKTKLARQMVKLLDEYIPVVQGSEINDDPLHPLSRFALDQIEALGDETPITWLHREERFSEKLATPDVTVADLIGDIDPIKAAHLKLSYADDRVIHFGMIPRANRCIFIINELPDLQPRIQVALFNILQEGDVQIRGFKLRLALDMQFVFTANPEDYTHRGSIVTPLKDRIGSQILTHYPEDITIARSITAQEARLSLQQKETIHVPVLAQDLIEQLSFEARDSEFIDAKSGVSARMSITAFENLVSTAERRALVNNEEKTVVRFGDLLGVIPAVTGKVELVYEGEQEGSVEVARSLLGDAIKTLFSTMFPKIEKLTKEDAIDPYEHVITWFFEQSGFELEDTLTDTQYKAQLDRIKPLSKLIDTYQPDILQEDRYFMMEFVLWGLVEYKKLSKYKMSTGLRFNDLFGRYISGLS